MMLRQALGIGGESGFTYIRRYTGFISPGIMAVFLLGLFWKRTTAPAAIAGILSGVGLSVFFNNYTHAVLGTETLFYTAFPNGHGSYEIPFLICMGLSFAFTFVLMVGISLASPAINPQALHYEAGQLKVAPGILALIMVTLLLTIALYAKLW